MITDHDPPLHPRPGAEYQAKRAQAEQELAGLRDRLQTQQTDTDAQETTA